MPYGGTPDHMSTRQFDAMRLSMRLMKKIKLMHPHYSPIIYTRGGGGGGPQPDLTPQSPIGININSEGQLSLPDNGIPLTIGDIVSQSHMFPNSTSSFDDVEINHDLSLATQALDGAPGTGITFGGGETYGPVSDGSGSANSGDGGTSGGSDGSGDGGAGAGGD